MKRSSHSSRRFCVRPRAWRRRNPREIAVLAADPWAYRNRVRLPLTPQGIPAIVAGDRTRHPDQRVPHRRSLVIEAALAFARMRRDLAPTLQPAELSLFCNADESKMLAGIFLARRGKLDLDRFAGALQERVPSLKGIEVALEAQERRPAVAIAHWGALRSSTTPRASPIASITAASSR